MPGGSRAFRTDHSAAAEGDDDMAKTIQATETIPTFAICLPAPVRSAQTIPQRPKVTTTSEWCRFAQLRVAHR